MIVARRILSGAYWLTLPLSLLAADWPQWRGLNRDGVSPETGLLAAWPKEGPRQVWKVSGLGEGFSGFSVAQGRLFTQGQRGDQQFVKALDAATGRRLWETVITQSPFREYRGHGPRGTPTVDGDRVYAQAGDGTLASLDARTGALGWTLTMEKFGGRVPKWGYSESPLVDGDLLIVTPGGPGAAVVALDKRTGKAVWKSQSDHAGYSSPIVAEVGGIRHYIVFTGAGVIGLHARTGELLWRYDKVANGVANIATPIFVHPHVFVSSDYGTGCATLKLSAEGGRIKAQEIFFSKEMKNHYSTSVVAGHWVYGFSSSILTAMNLLTGQVAWRERSVGKGSVLLADGRLYLLSEDGVVGMAEASPERYVERARFSIPRGQFNTWAPPVVANGRMYLREQDNVYCFDVKGK